MLFPGIFALIFDPDLEHNATTAENDDNGISMRQVLLFLMILNIAVCYSVNQNRSNSLSRHHTAICDSKIYDLRRTGLQYNTFIS